jgi:hypothetical protein
MLQPNYIPWKGVFDLISRVDIFVFYDDVQYTKRDWRNRNKIKTKDGEKWLTVPIKNKGKQLIYEVEIDNQIKWQENHFKTIKNSYSNSPFFKNYEFIIEEIYLNKRWEKISDLDVYSTKYLANLLNLDVKWILASELGITGNKEGEKIIKICKELGCDYFINGPSAKKFMDIDLFKKSNIELDFMVYKYPEYKQLHGEFSHFVSIIDVLFNCGPDATKFIFSNNNI